MKINAAISHYNSPDTLRHLLGQLQQDQFDQIVVLDDCSDDHKKLLKVEKDFPDVTFCYGKQNVGAGANRNRVLDVVNEGIVWFVDTDMEIISQNNAETLHRIFKRHYNQLIGGLIYARSGQQMDWNYGHEMHPVHDARFEELVMSLQAGDASAWSRLERYQWDYAWLQAAAPAHTRPIDWVAEGSFALPIELFRQLDGYDTAFRYHEGQDLARRVRMTGARVRFVPDIVTRHLEIDVRKHRREGEFEAARYLFFQKHWRMSPEVYKGLYK